MADPRQAKTMGEAARNQDGTYNGFRALSWMSAALSKSGKGLSEEEVKAMFAEAVARKKAREAQK